MQIAFQNQAKTKRVLALFGAGLIGSRLMAMLSVQAPAKLSTLPFDWSDPDGQKLQSQVIIDEIIKLSQSTPEPTLIEIVWAAGRAGFYSSEEDTQKELQSFHQTLSLAGDLSTRLPDQQVRFILLSSIGGLFEGQRLVDQNTLPNPTRPYGRLKLAQENALVGDTKIAHKKIFRMSSVFGRPRPGQRLGLIPTMIFNATSNRVTHIQAYMSTLRDFVWLDDICEYLIRHVLFQKGEIETSSTCKPEFLCSGRPIAIYQLQSMIQNLVRKKIYVTYSVQPNNFEDITVSPVALPSGWQTSDLRTNLAQVYQVFI